MEILFNSEYWLKEKQKTQLELSELINGKLFSLKTAKTDEDNITKQDIDKLIKAKFKYIQFCEDKYQEELAKENQVQKKSLLYIEREYGY